MRIAVIGTGISGLVSAYLLAGDHEISVYEANDYVGGHTHTVDATQHGQTYAVDTGFIVFNAWTYPNFIRLLKRLGVQSQPSVMGFSVRCEQTGLEFSGTSLNTLFAQRRNVFRPEFYRLIADILRFFRKGKRFVRQGDVTCTMAQFLDQSNYSPLFRQKFLLPMMSAIWSSAPSAMEHVPAHYYLDFFANHGLLNVWHRSQWRVIQGGSREYIPKLTRSFRDRIRINAPVRQVCRSGNGVLVTTESGENTRFDHAVLAVHSDQALRLLADPTPQERAILGAIPYQKNETVLHTDVRLLPRSRRAWASWNYHYTDEAAGHPAVTYNMNMLQNLSAPDPFCVTLNRGAAISADHVQATFQYDHPLLDATALRAQQRHAEISGVDRTHYCGAYWGAGFHEDGVNSALRVCKYFGKEL